MYFRIQNHNQIARGSYDLNIDFRSFDNGLKQLCVTNFIEEYIVKKPPCELNNMCVLTTAESRENIGPVKYIQAPADRGP